MYNKNNCGMSFVLGGLRIGDHGPAGLATSLITVIKYKPSRLSLLLVANVKCKMSISILVYTG